MKRKIKKQLKEDEFVSSFSKIFDFAKKWKKEIIAAAVIVALVAALFGGFQLIKAAQVRKDSRTAGEILELRVDLPKNPQNVARLEQLADRGKFSRLAAISLASYWLEQGDLDKAQKALAAVKDIPKDFFYYQAQDLTAQIEILKQSYDRAVAILKKIEDEKPKDYLLDAVLYRHAEALEKKGDKAGALKLYKRVQEEYMQTYFGYDASQKTRKLESEK
jgi:predicted negative regulator of RcsB-dependent stress response